MEWLEGTPVRLIHTGDEGIITKDLGNDMVNVLLNDGVEIPVSVDDIKVSSGQTKAKTSPKKKPVSKEQAFHPKVIQGKSAVTNKGLMVSFETSYDYDGNPERYKIHLINDSYRDVIFNYNLSYKNGNNVQLNGVSKSNTAFPLGEMLFDELNDAPILDFECWIATTSGRGKQMDKTIKIKAKQFFKKIRRTPILNGETHLYELLQNLPVEEIDRKEATLEEYTQNIIEEKKEEVATENYYRIYKVLDKAHFKNEIDLHIEKLVDDPKSMTNSEKLHLQVQTFEKYIEDAYEVGYDKVFIIHGLGKGRLRDIVASRLIRHEHVATFKNSYHKKYGFGATEVIFKKK